MFCEQVVFWSMWSIRLLLVNIFPFRLFLPGDSFFDKIRNTLSSSGLSVLCFILLFALTFLSSWCEFVLESVKMTSPLWRHTHTDIPHQASALACDHQGRWSHTIVHFKNRIPRRSLSLFSYPMHSICTHYSNCFLFSSSLIEESQNFDTFVQQRTKVLAFWSQGLICKGRREKVDHSWLMQLHIEKDWLLRINTIYPSRCP